MASVMNVCDRCGSSVSPGMAVCPNCGAPLGGVDASAGGVPPETVRTSALDADLASNNDLPQPGTQMPVGGHPSEPPANPWQESLPPAAPAGPGPQVYNTPPGAAPTRRSPWLWVAGCCLALVLLGCLLSIALSGWVLNNFTY